MITRLSTALAIIASLSVAAVIVDGEGALAATITTSYESGHRHVSINDYRTEAMGTFRLEHAGISMLALCIEADQPHTTVGDAYSEVAVNTASAELDTLIWLIDQTAPDDDTATAAAALAWYYADAQRSVGGAVWSNWAADFAPIGPHAPESWDALPPFGLSHPVGLRSGRTDLDAVEHKVAELDRRVQSLTGTWTLSAQADLGRFQLRSTAGPIGARLVTVTITTATADAVTIQLTTDAQGHVVVDTSAITDGAKVHATVAAPGPHREWDGTGGVQRMVTATSITVEANFEIPPMDRHIGVLKHTSDSTIGVADGEFLLTDANGAEVERVITDPEGRATFKPIDPLRHPAPYVISEVAAPPGLTRSAPDQALTGASTDPFNPTIVEFTDDPILVPVVIRKQLSVPAAGPTDRSGFAFSIVRQQDGWADEMVTGPSGDSDPLPVPIGSYQICETDVPAWASGLQDGGCQVLEIDLAATTAGTTINISYLNLVPPPSIDTAAHDLADGDQVIGVAGGTMIDSVVLTGLVPWSHYSLVADLVSIAAGGTATVIQTSSIDFAPETTDATFEVAFEVPAVEPTSLVVVERLMLGDQVVSVHDDLTDRDQTIDVLAPPTTTTTTTTTTPTPPTTAAPTSTTSSTTPASPTTVSTPPPVATVPPTTPSATLPRTGNDESALLLRFGDIGFIMGIALLCVASLVPRRHEFDSQDS